MRDNSLAARMHGLIKESGFWGSGPLHVQLHGIGRAYLRRKRHKDPRICRPQKVAHIHLMLPCDWIETVHESGLMTAFKLEAGEKQVFILEADPVACESAEQVDGLWRVSYAWPRGQRIVGAEGWLARYGGRQVVSNMSTVAAVEQAHAPFLEGLIEKSSVNLKE